MATSLAYELENRDVTLTGNATRCSVDDICGVVQMFVSRHCVDTRAC